MRSKIANKILLKISDRTKIKVREMANEIIKNKSNPTTMNEQKLTDAEMRIKHLIFYGIYKDENIDHLEESPKHIDYALTQAFIWMKESTRFHAENVERILWKRIGILAHQYHNNTESVDELRKEVHNHVRDFTGSPDGVMESHAEIFINRIMKTFEPYLQKQQESDAPNFAEWTYKNHWVLDQRSMVWHIEHPSGIMDLSTAKTAQELYQLFKSNK